MLWRKPSRRTSVLRLLFCSTLMLYGATAYPQPTPLSSDAILSGVGPYTPKVAWPDTIVLPQAWRTGFKSLAGLQRSLGKEQGACLSASTNVKKAPEIVALLQAYLKLRDDRGRLPDADFRGKEKALRDKIEASGGSSENMGFTWQVGTPQSGNEQSINIETNASSCEGNYLGRVHSHPSSPATPSETDAANTVTGDARLSVVVSPDETTCVQVRGSGDKMFVGRNPFNFGPYISGNKTIKGEFIIAVGIHGQAINYRNAIIRASSKSITAPELEHSQYRRLMATGLSIEDGALYCGRVDQALSRVAPYQSAELIDGIKGDQRELVFAVKAAIIMIHRLEQTAWLPQPMFSFKPDIDEALISYLRELPKSADLRRENIAAAIRSEAGENITSIHLEDVYRLLLILSGPNFPTFTSSGMQMPDDRSSATRAKSKFEFLCGSTEDGDFFCRLAEFENNKYVRTIAEYSESTVTRYALSVHAFADHRTGVYESGADSRLSYRGELAADPGKFFPRPQGQGMMDLGPRTFKGNFVRGVPQGPGLLTEKSTGTTRNALYENSQWKILP